MLSAWITSKSCYVQNVSTFGTGCIGMKVDGDLHNGGNKPIVANDFTQVIHGIGYWANGEVNPELVSRVYVLPSTGYPATNGGKVRATNGNNQYGDSCSGCRRRNAHLKQQLRQKLTTEQKKQL